MTEPGAPDGFPTFTPTEVGVIAMHEFLEMLIKAGWPERRAILYLIMLGEQQKRNDEQGA
jgi:hypothetical protein